ncbi:ATP-binding protein [Clostridium perfringens]|uniref:ATP-binding protein n=1 Tax=Clostridium perfringens TaxID=1502 RepID=UPI001A1C2E55|nr:sensor histidine kinase [Clostridium perfringens]
MKYIQSNLEELERDFALDSNVEYIRGFQNKELLILDRMYKINIEELINESIYNLEYVGETIERDSKDLLRSYIKDIKLRNFYAYIMREMIRNVCEHSKAKEAYLLIYISEDKKELGFKVIDNGIGLKKSLKENPNYNTINDNKTAVILAVKPGVSRSYKRDPNRDDVWQNSGFGLYMISSICERYGNFYLVSGNFGINIKNSNTDYLKYQKTRIKGTEVTVSINLSLIKDIPRLLKEISLKGNETAEANNLYKIKTASQASTLIEE